MQTVCDENDPVFITRLIRNKSQITQTVVMLSLEDYDSLNETAYLMRSPKNANRLLKAIKQLKSGKGTEKELPELT